MNEHSPMPCFPISLWPGMLLVAPKIGGCGCCSGFGQHAALARPSSSTCRRPGTRLRSTRPRCGRAPRATSRASRRDRRRSPRARRASTSGRCRSRRGRRRGGRAPRPTPRCGSGGCTASAAGARRSRCGCSRCAPRPRRRAPRGSSSASTPRGSGAPPSRTRGTPPCRRARPARACSCTPGAPCRASRAWRRGSRRTARTSSSRTPLEGVVDQGADGIQRSRGPQAAPHGGIDVRGTSGGTVGRQGRARHRRGVGARRGAPRSGSPTKARASPAST